MPQNVHDSHKPENIMFYSVSVSFSVDFAFSGKMKIVEEPNTFG